MPLDRDQRGFVLSGLALLLILPAMLLSASCLTLFEIGGETVSLQSGADKVYYTGLNLEDTIKWMWLDSGVPVDNGTLSVLRAECENATGLVVNIYNVGDNYAKVRIIVQDPRGNARFDDVLELGKLLRS